MNLRIFLKQENVMTFLNKTMIGVFASVLALTAVAEDFYRMDEALPGGIDVAAIAPVFDFDGDGCLPSAGISRTGEQNPGLRPTGTITGNCRTNTFLDSSNTLHRHACQESQGNTYCAHFFALYFEKDQVVNYIQSGHRHDWEHAAVWTINGQVTHGSYSAHGDLFTQPFNQLPTQNGHLKVVYHKDGLSTHAMRFAGSNEAAENAYGTFVTPLIISWDVMSGDGIDNAQLRAMFNSYDYGSGTVPMKDSNFLANINNYRPAAYPVFTSIGGSSAGCFSLVNNASGLCLDIDDAVMANGTSVIQWHCTNTPWQAWSYNEGSGEIRSQHDSAFCLDNSSVWGNGANVVIWQCNGSDAQKFSINGDGSISMRTMSSQVLDGYGTNPADNVGTWDNWGGDNQRWTIAP
ncbi:NPP1 family protein [Teredinibacter turnerae]|uniref:NPP1 family protein n=1 Tax=Teredinibacter turnerae TaxID=2426 RepID=UPI000360F1B7